MGEAIEVLTSESTQPVLETLGGLYERKIGRRVRGRCDSAKLMLARIRAGETGGLVERPRMNAAAERNG